MDPHSTRIEKGMECQTALTTPGTEATAPWIAPRPIPRVRATRVLPTRAVQPKSTPRPNQEAGGVLPGEAVMAGSSPCAGPKAPVTGRLRRYQWLTRPILMLP